MAWVMRGRCQSNETQQFTTHIIHLIQLLVVKLWEVCLAGTFLWGEHRCIDRSVSQPRVTKKWIQCSRAIFMAKTDLGFCGELQVVSFVPTGTLFFSTSEMEIGVEPVHRGGLWRLTSISPVTLSADTPRNIGHVLPWWLNTGSGLTAVKPHYKKEYLCSAYAL